MRKIILGITTLIFSTSVFATTAILCGDVLKVDQNNKYASVHLVFDQEESRSPDEISVAYYGKESKIASVIEKQGRINIQTLTPTRVVVVNKKNIESSSCDGETNFTVKVVQNEVTSSMYNCRCFVD
jgi:hypothetical protein